MELGKYSFGIGDRFGRQGNSLLSAMIKAAKINLDVVPVWNKSHREHMIVGSTPVDVRKEADASVKQLGWKSPTTWMQTILILTMWTYLLKAVIFSP